MTATHACCGGQVGPPSVGAGAAGPCRAGRRDRVPGLAPLVSLQREAFSDGAQGYRQAFSVEGIDRIILNTVGSGSRLRGHRARDRHAACLGGQQAARAGYGS